MHNLAFGIPTILLSLLIFFLAWRYHQKGNYRIAILLLLVGGLLLRVFVSADMFLHPWDERYHALVAKNLMNHPLIPALYNNPVLDYDYKNWLSNHIWLHKQPMALWCMAGSMKIFGVNEIALRLPSIIFSTLSIILTFQVGRYFFDKKVAFFGAFLMALNGMVLDLVAGRIPTDHVDTAFLFFVLLSVYLSIRFVRSRSILFSILTGICIGIAVLTKWLPALIVLPVYILIVIDSGKFKTTAIILNLAMVVIFSLLVFLPWQWYIFDQFPDEAEWESYYNFLHLSHEVEGRGGEFWFYLDKIRINYGELIYLPFIWFLLRSLKNWRNLKLLALTVWMIIPLVFFSSVSTKMQAYTLFISPVFFLITGSFFFWLLEYRKVHKYKFLTGLVLVLLIALAVRHSIERIKPFNIMDRNPEWVEDLKALNAKNFENGVLFNYPNPIEAMFYTRLVVYDVLPAAEELGKLQSNNYTVLINESDTLPDNLKEVEGLVFLKLNTE